MATSGLSTNGLPVCGMAASPAARTPRRLSRPERARACAGLATSKESSEVHFRLYARPRAATFVVLATVLAGCGATVPPAAEPEPVPVPAAEPEVVSEVVSVEPPPFTVSIAAVGDMMLGTDYPKNILPDDDGAGFLAEVTPILQAADLAFGNLEGVLIDGGEPAKRCTNENACFMFRSPTRYAHHYAAAGFDALSLANNHARDFGEEGRLSSMRVLSDVGIRHSGLIDDFATLEFRGRRIAFMAYAVTRNSNLVLDYDIARATVAGFAGTHDLVVVSFHAGAEGRDVLHLPFAEETYFGEARGDVVKFARMMVDAGADLVFGHGPHVVRAMELYKDRLIAYSLGNFATYYGISVDGDRGVAPILIATLDDSGRFVGGQVRSTIQIRPAGPTIDSAQRALRLIKELSSADFGDSGLRFGSDGTITPAPREYVQKHPPDEG